MARNDGIQTNWNFNITVSGAELVTASLNTIQKAAKNIDLSKYWISQEQMIESLTKAIDEYNTALTMGDRGALGSAATEVVNLGRALQTISGDQYGSIIESTGLGNLDSIISQARKSADGMVLSVKELEEAFSFFGNMEKYGLDVQSVMRSIGDSGEIDRLQNELNQLQEDYNDTQDAVETWRDRYYSSLNDARIETERLNAEIERLKSDFANTDNGILVQQLNDLQAELDETKEKLASANDTDFKLDNIDTQIKEVIDKLDNLWDKLKNGDFTSGADGTFSPIANLLNGLSAGVETAGATIDQANSKILELANSLKTLQSSLDLTSIVTLNNLLKTIQSLETLKVNSTGIKNFKLLMDQISNYKDASVAIGQLKQISEIDWSKLNALVVPKGSADFFTAISKVKNADEVKKLSKADFSKWSTFKVSKQAFVDNITTFIKLINSKTTDIEKFKQLTALDFSNFNNIKFDKNSLNAMSQLLSSLTVAERLDNLERRLTGGGGGGGGNVPSGPNLVPPDTELDVLGKAMAGVGATDADIERVVGRFTELGLRAQSARAAVAEIGEEGEKLYNIVATTTDEFGNTVNHLIQYSDATNDVSVNLGNAANRLKELSEADLSKNLRSVIDLLGSREDLKGTATGQEMSRYADELGKALEAVQTGAMSANDAVNQFVTGGRAGFENLTNVVNQFKLEASQTAKPIEDAAMSEKQRADAVRQLDASLNTIQANEQKWSAAKDSSNESSRAAYEIYMRQADAIEGLKDKVQTANIGQQEYANSVAAIKGEMAECERVIKSNGDAYDKNKNILVNGSSAQEKAIKQVSRAYEEAQENLKKWQSIANNPTLGASYQQYKEASDGLAVLNTNLRSGTMTQEEYTREWNKLSGTMASAKKTIDDSGRSFDTVGDKIGKVVQKFSGLFSAVRVFNAVKRVMREMVQNVRDLDSSFAQLRIVTGATDAEMEKFAAVSADMAKNLGQSVTDVTKSIEVFSRLGYNLSDATDLSKFATIMANVGDVTTDAATTGITAIIKGFEMEAADAEHVADVLVNVGQKYAISAEELMTAFEKSGAALHATNTDFEKSVALYAAANASIQNASTVGRMLPMRIAICV